MENDDTLSQRERWKGVGKVHLVKESRSKKIRIKYQKEGAKGRKNRERKERLPVQIKNGKMIGLVK